MSPAASLLVLASVSRRKGSSVPSVRSPEVNEERKKGRSQITKNEVQNLQ